MLQIITNDEYTYYSIGAGLNVYRIILHIMSFDPRINYGALNGILVVLFKIQFCHNKIHFCRQNSFLSWQKSILSNMYANINLFAYKIDFCYLKWKLKHKNLLCKTRFNLVRQNWLLWILWDKIQFSETKFNFVLQKSILSSQK